MLATRGIAAEYSSTTTRSRPGCATRARGHSRSTSRGWGATARINCRKLEAGRADANEASEEIAATMITICREGSGQWAVGSGQWAVGSGQWAVGSGQWAVGSGQWAVGSGQWAVGRLDEGG